MLEDRAGKSLDLVLTGRNSGIAEVLTTLLLPPGHFPHPDLIAPTQADVLDYVASHPNTMGIVSLAALNAPDALPVRVLYLRADSAPALLPSALTAYRGTYPLRSAVFLYTTALSGPLAAGFATFAAGLHGQQIVQETGLAPATLPVRHVTLNPSQP